MSLGYEIDLASGRDDRVAAVLSVEDVPESVTEIALARHYEKFVRVFMRHIPNAQVIAVRRVG